VPEFAAPKVGARSNRVQIEAELKSGSTGVLYALGAFSGGLSLWVEKGKLSFEYNLFEIERTRIDSTGTLPAGKVTIEVESKLAAAHGAARLHRERRLRRRHGQLLAGVGGVLRSGTVPVRREDRAAACEVPAVGRGAALVGVPEAER